MARSRTDKRQLFFAALIFALGGVDALQSQDPIVGVTNLTATAVNLVALRYVDRAPRATALAMSAVNALVAVAMVIANVRAGKSYIQYAWALAALFFVVSGIVAYVCDRRRPPVAEE